MQILKIEMETIFDHKATKDELERLTGFSNKSEYLENTTVRNAYSKIAVLYRMRNDNKKAVYYDDLANNELQILDESY